MAALVPRKKVLGDGIIRLFDSAGMKPLLSPSGQPDRNNLVRMDMDLELIVSHHE
jgi:hypothetical protein